MRLFILAYVVGVLLTLGAVFAQVPSFDMGMMITGQTTHGGGGGGPTVACAVGPNAPFPTGTVGTDLTTAGFTTCANNSDFSNSFFATLSNWLGGVNGCGGATNPIWYNANTLTNAPPCTDYNIITDGSNGQVLDLTFTQTDFNNGVGSTAPQSYNPNGGSIQGQVYPSGMYVEHKSRITSGTYTFYNSLSTNCCLSWAPYRFNTRFNSSPDVEVDFDEMGGKPFGVLPGIPGFAGTYVPVPPAMQQCQPGCSQSSFDPTLMHTYGFLFTTDGTSQYWACTYLDGNKLGCANGSATATELQQYTFTFMPIGPETDATHLASHTPPVTYPAGAGSMDVDISYWRIWTCSDWINASAGHTCSGTMVTH